MTGVLTVIHEIAVERGRQEQVWGEQNHPDGTGTDWVSGIIPAYGWKDPVAAHVADLAKRDCKQAATRGTQTWLKIAREEMAEAFAETDPDKLRIELVQTAAVLVNWIQAIDRRPEPE